MKKFKLIILTLIIIFIILFFIKVDTQKFIKIYYIQLIIVLIIFFVFLIIFKFKIFLSFLLIFLISSIYFYFYPNYFQKKSVNFSETFIVTEKVEVKEINLDISLNTGNLKIESNPDKECLIFDYNSKYKFFNYSKIKKGVLNYEIFENPVFRRIDSSNSEWNLKLNEEKIVNLNIQTNSINGYIDLKNIKIKNLNFNSNSSRVELFLPEKEGNIFLNLNFRASIIDIYISKNFYIEVNLKSIQTITNILESNFKEKENNIFYLDGGDKGKIYINITGKNLNIKFHFTEE